MTPKIISASEVFTLVTCECQGCVLWGPLTRTGVAVDFMVPDVCPECGSEPVTREARLALASEDGFQFTFGKTMYDVGGHGAMN